MFFRKVCDILENIYQEVDFNKHCKTCKYEELSEKFDPCNECLDSPMNSYSDKPIYWEEEDE